MTGAASFPDPGDDRFLALFHNGAIPERFLPALCKVHRTFYVPSETVVRTPGIAVPDVGRIYATNTFLSGGKTVGYVEICENPGFRGTESETELFLVELFSDEGDDGHVRYVITGHALMTKEQYLRYVEESGFSL